MISFRRCTEYNVEKDSVKCEFKPGSYGIAWDGQADTIVRLIRGYDLPLTTSIEAEVKKEVDDYYDSTSTAVARIVQDILDKFGATALPDGVDTSLPPRKSIKLGWDAAKLAIQYQSLPVQDAVDFVSFLVFMQSARSKFVPGVATVGGRTHVGVVEKEKGFTMLNEPELKHRNIGFTDDI